MLQLIPIPNLPLFAPGDDVGAEIAAAMTRNGQQFYPGDILLIAQKIVSKAEDRFVRLGDVTPSARAKELAAITGKDPRLVEVILWDTAEIIRAGPRVLIVEHRAGFISANAGVDHSNVAPAEADMVLRLPADADASAARVRDRLAGLTGHRPPVLVIDSHGRPWRVGAAGVAIGLAGLKPVQDLRGQPDLFGTPLRHTHENIADQLAAAASLVMGQTTAACPAVIARGLAYTADETARAGDILRPKPADLFR
ncbi:MAG: coenzyme F420-0:L-glutamate ligase [Anaerolineae bacterium]